MIFNYIAKSGQERYVALADDLVLRAVRDLLARRSGGPELLAYKDGRHWHDVSSNDINSYLKDLLGEEMSAKDFRTWHGTVIAAVVLAEANERARTYERPQARRFRSDEGSCRLSRQHACRGPRVVR